MHFLGMHIWKLQLIDFDAMDESIVTVYKTTLLISKDTLHVDKEQIKFECWCGYE